MNDWSLVVAAHGSRHDPVVNSSVEAVARSAALLVAPTEYAAAFHEGVPGFEGVLDRLSTNLVVVVPFMTSAGHYCQVVLPGALQRSAGYAGKCVQITAPIGTHRRMAEMVSERVEGLSSRYQLEANKTTIALIGHGTKRHPKSRQATFALGRQLRWLHRRRATSPRHSHKTVLRRQDRLLPPAGRAYSRHDQSDSEAIVSGLVREPAEFVNRLKTGGRDAYRKTVFVRRNKSSQWGTCPVVIEAFLDDEPRIESVLDRWHTACLIVVPFLIGTGRHAMLDLRVRLGQDGADAPLGPRSMVSGGRMVIFDDPVGQLPGIAELVAERAAGLVGWNRFSLPADQVEVHADRGGSLQSGPGHRARRTDRGRRDVREVRIGTRGSRLALEQTDRIVKRLRAINMEPRVMVISSLGDRRPDTPLEELPGDAPFTDDLESALFDGRVDVVVHSLKDLPLNPTRGLTISAFPERGDPRECLVSRHGETLAALPAGAIIGTSSFRRAAQIRRLRPDIRTAPIRGSVIGRIRQLDDGFFDAVVLAVAGLERLNLLERISQYFTFEEILPAPGQGTLAVQTRADDTIQCDLFALWDEPDVRRAVIAELAVARALERPPVVVAAYAVATELLDLRVRLLGVSEETSVDVRVRDSDPDSAVERVLAVLEGKMNGHVPGGANVSS